MSEIIDVAGITYKKPQVFLLQETGIGTAEYAARTCYDSFDNSENEDIKNFNRIVNDKSSLGSVGNDKLQEFYKNGCEISKKIVGINNIESSELLHELAWTFFHHSILEHANLTYLIKGISRGLLQEHARHRIQSISVRSTRYTMGSILNAFVASLCYENMNGNETMKWFVDKITEMDMFVTDNQQYNNIEIRTAWTKLNFQRNILGHEEFIKIAVAKSSLEFLDIKDADILFEKLESGKKKRNVGDAFKHLVTDNWKVDMVVTFNLRSLKNYFTLRDSGAAYFQIRALAQAMKDATPKKYLDLIIKNNKGITDD